MMSWNMRELPGSTWLGREISHNVPALKEWESRHKWLCLAWLPHANDAMLMQALVGLAFWHWQLVQGNITTAEKVATTPVKQWEPIIRRSYIRQVQCTKGWVGSWGIKSRFQPFPYSMSRIRSPWDEKLTKIKHRQQLIAWFNDDYSLFILISHIPWFFNFHLLLFHSLRWRSSATRAGPLYLQLLSFRNFGA